MAQTPDGPKRKYIYGRKYKDVERKLAEAMGDAAKGIYFDDENQTVAQYMERADLVFRHERFGPYHGSSTISG
jgi:hypothetical protein